MRLTGKLGLTGQLLCSSALMTLATVAPGFAQDAAPAPASQGAAALDEVIVTAEHRAVNLQQTPMNITALTADALAAEGIGDSRTLLDSVAGMDMTFGNPNNFIGLYGLMSSGGSMWADPVMTFNYGGIPLNRQTSASSSMYDLERVEVLKGPQGTLYGRNATVGAVNLIVNRPTHEYGGDMSVVVGNYNAFNTTGAVNLPVNEEIAARVAFQTTSHDGYFTNGLDDASNYGGRISVLYEPNDDVSLLLWTDFYRNRSRGQYFTWRYYLSPTQEWIDPDNPWYGLTPAGTCSNQLLCPSFASTSVGGVNAQTPFSGFADQSPTGLANYSLVGGDGYNNADQEIYAAQLDWDTSLGTFTALAARVNTQINFLTYSNGLRFTNDTDAHQNSLELRLASNDGGMFEWQVGAFYFYETQNAFQNNMQSTGWAMLYTPHLDDENYAAFVDGTWNVTDSFRLLAGARQTHEEKTQDGYTTATNVTVPNMAIFTGAGATCYTASVAAKVQFRGFFMPSNFCVVPNGGLYEDDNLSWKLGAELDLAPESMIYLTARTGFRAGGFTAGTQNVYKPEELTAYEFGSRNRFFDGRLQANLSAFYWQYNDQQLSQLQQYFLNGIALGQTSFPFNVDGYLNGVELDLQALVTENDRVALNILNIAGQYDQTPLLVSSVGVTTSLTDQDRFNLPEWQVTASYNHMFETTAGQFDLGVQAHYESDTFLRLVDSPGLLPGDIKDAYVKWDADLTWRPDNSDWEVQGFVRNITNEAIVGVGSSGQLSTGVWFKVNTNPTGFRNASLEPPRTFGLRLSTHF